MVLNDTYVSLWTAADSLCSIEPSCDLIHFYLEQILLNYNEENICNGAEADYLIENRTILMLEVLL